MGFLEAGAPLSWRESLRFLNEVKRRGVREFIELYHQYKDDIAEQSNVFWGDEVEFCLVQLDKTTRTTRLFLGADEVLDELRTREALHAEALHKENGERRCSAVSASSFPSSSSLSLRGGGEGCLSEIEATDKAAEDEEKQRFSNATSSTSRLCVGRGGAREGDWESAGCHYTWKLSGWHPEYGSHMIEAIPGKPYPLDLNSLFYLLPSMQIRRKKVQAALPPHCYAASLGSFPTMGVRTPGVEPRRRVRKHWADGDKSENVADPVATDKGQEVDVFYPGDFASPPAVPDPVKSCSRSLFIGDEMINKHPRFSTLTANIRERRGEKVQILLPLFQDENTLKVFASQNEHEEKVREGDGGSDTDSPQVGTAESRDRSLAALRRQRMLEGQALHDGHWIYMDCMGFGMGMHCVQATFGCRTLSDARYLYDQLGVLAPLWLALTAATPFARGLVASTDTRWDTIAASVDCRTKEERTFLPKSRYESISLYISDRPPLKNHVELYNDVPAPVEPRAFAALVRNGVDEILARHVAFLFIRDPMVIFRDRLLRDVQEGEGGEEEAVRQLEADGERDWAEDDGRRYTTTEDFENLQSTNWNSVRFKPPPRMKSVETAKSKRLPSRRRVQDLLGPPHDRQEEGVSADEEGSRRVHEEAVRQPRRVSFVEAADAVPCDGSETEEARPYSEEEDADRNASAKDSSEESQADREEPQKRPVYSQGGEVVGWRVEFRTPDAQLTDFENAACIALIRVLAQVILEENLDLYIPMSLNDDNMHRASKMNAINNEKFWFRNDISHNASDRSYREMSLNEILFGPAPLCQQHLDLAPSRDHHSSSPPSPLPPSQGLVHRCLNFVEKELKCGRCSKDTAAQLLEYLDFIRYRALGILGTDAIFLRASLLAHPAYKRDSIIPSSAAFDLVDLCVKVGRGDLRPRSVFGPFSSRSAMRITDDGVFDNGLPVISPDFPCPSDSVLSRVRDEVVFRRLKLRLENPTRALEGEEEADEASSACSRSCLGRQAEEERVAHGSVRIEQIRRILGSRVPVAVAVEWDSGEFLEYFRTESCAGRGVAGIEAQILAEGRGKSDSFSRAALPGFGSEDSTWDWVSLAGQDRSFCTRESGEGKSEGNGSTCCPSVGWDDTTETPQAAVRVPVESKEKSDAPGLPQVW